MKGVLILTLVLALLATGGISLLALWRRPTDAVATEQPPGPPDLPGTVGTTPPDVIRPYQTTATLTEDLRDALAADDPTLQAELWRVSVALEPRAQWVLTHLAPSEASPRVRALLVFAAGVHLPDAEILLGFLGDRAPEVRAAAALAAGRRSGGAGKGSLLGRIAVPVGREAPGETVERIRARAEREDDEGVRGTLLLVAEAMRPIPLPIPRR